MPRKSSRVAIAGSLVLFLFFLMHSVQAQSQKIRVAVKNATIRSSPSMEGKVVLNPDLGSVFDVVSKTDEWYEIKITPRRGIEATGYIHEIFVELIDVEPQPEVKIEPEKKVLSQPVKVAPPKEKRTHPKSEIALNLSYLSGYKMDETSSYFDEWSWFEAELIQDDATIRHQFKNPFGLGIVFNQLFLGGLGVQLRFDMNSKTTLNSDSVSEYTFSWKWHTSSLASMDDEWPIKGNASLAIGSVNIYYKILGLGKVAPHISGGVSYSSGKMAINTESAISISWLHYEGASLMQTVDWVPLPYSIDAKIGGLGFNIGGGVDISVMRNLAIGIAARYFSVPKIKKEWQIGTGTYLSENSSHPFNVSQDLADHIRDTMGPVAYDPSFFSVLLIFKFLF